MSKVLETGQAELLSRRSVSIVNLVELTTYADRITTDSPVIHYYAERYTTWNGQQYLPFLLSISGELASMVHIPVPTGGLTEQRNLSMELLNGTTDANVTLWQELRVKNLLQADLTWRQIVVDETTTASLSDLDAFGATEMTVRFRGRITEAGNVTDTKIGFHAVTSNVRLPWIVATDSTKVDPRDLGAHLPIVYGSKKNVSAINLDVGFVTTLAEVITASTDAIATLEVTDTTGFATAGSARIGTEEISWTGKTATTLTTVARAQTGTKEGEHSAGESIVEIIAAATFAVAGHEVDAINDVYIRNPYDGKVTRVTTDFTKTVANTTAVSGETIATVSFTIAELRTLLDELFASAKVTQQPGVSHPTVGSLAEQFISSKTGPGDFIDFQTANNAPAFDLSEMHTASSGQFGTVTFDDPGTITSQDFRVSVGRGSFSGSSSTVCLRFRKNNSVGDIILDLTWAQIPQGGATRSTAAIVSTPDFNTVWWQCTSSTTGAPRLWFTRRNNVSYSAEAPTISTPTAVSGASVGFTLQLFADIDGVPVPTEDTGFQSRYSMDNDAANWTVEVDPSTTTSCAIANWPVSAEGVGSLRLVGSSPVAGEALISRTFSTENWTAKSIRFQVLVVTAANVTATDGVRIRLGNITSLNWSEWNFGTGDGITVGAFSVVTLDLTATPDTTNGTGFDVTDVMYFSLRMNVVGGATSRTFYIDDIQLTGSTGDAYVASQGDLIEKPVDILRHLVTVHAGENVLDSNLTTLNTNLGSNKHAVDLRDIGSDFITVLDRLCWEMRTNAAREEAATQSLFKFYAAETDFGFPAKSTTITEFTNYAENGLDYESVATRFRMLFDYRPDAGDPTEGSSFQGLVTIDADTNDVIDPSTANLVAAEQRLGEVEAESMNMLAINDLATAKNVMGYYAHEFIRLVRIFELSGVPWDQAYDLERGDTVGFTPPNEVSELLCRVLSVGYSLNTGMSNLTIVEVTT